jgi:MFS family permease
MTDTVATYLGRLAAPFRHAAFRRVWFGQFINVLGDAVFAVSVALYLLPRADAAQTLALVLGALSAGGVVALLAGGVLADRHRRSRIIITADVVRAIGLAALLVLGRDAPGWSLALCAAVLGIGTGLYGPAYGALLSTLVPEEALPAANAVRALTNRSAAILGAAVAGVLAAMWSAQTVLAIDLATFLVSILTLVGVADRRPALERTDSSLFADVRFGLAYVLRRRWMTAVMLQGTIWGACVIAPIAILLPLLVGGEAGRWYGVIVAMEAVGAVIGAALGGVITPSRPGLTANLALLAMLPQVIAVGLDASPPILAAVSLLAGIGLSVFGVLWISALQRGVRKDYLGRVLSLDMLATQGIMPLGLVATGWLIPVLGPAVLAWIVSAVIVATSVLVLPISGVLELADSQHEIGEDVSAEAT